jgi:hypothetical protein
MKINPQTFQVLDEGGLAKKLLIAGAASLVLTLVGYFVDKEQFFHSYLVAYVFWVSLGLSGLFFTMLHHLTGAEWSVVIRRIFETLMMTLPVMAIFFIPVGLGLHDLYHWSHADVVAADPALLKKSAWLNTWFFIIRTAVYFGVWFLLARTLYKASLEQDGGHKESLALKMERVSAPGMVVFALSITFASFDWLMSLDAHWYSTIFGVYIFAGSWLALLALVTLIALWLREKKVLAEEITVEHYHDLGKLMFAFTVFWAYIAFSQYFLIWYGNIPEETVFYIQRWEGSWKAVSVLLVIGHFVIPFLALVTRAAKRNLTVLKAVGLWILFMHFVDLYWLVMPSLHHDGIHLSWMDVTAMVGIGGIFLWFFWTRFTSKAIVPIGDPALKTSMHFVNQ